MKGHSSDCITDSVIEWLNEKRDKSKPFFLKYNFKAAHGPFTPAKRYEQYLENVEIPEPDSLYAIGNHGSIANRGHNDELMRVIAGSVGPRHISLRVASNGGTSDREKTHLAYQAYLKNYLRCVKGIDDNIQRVIDYLKAEGLYENTIIVYTADQGFYLGEHDYRDKRWAYEEGMRMPLIIRFPQKIPAGTRSNAIVQNVDFAPTLLDFAGIDTPEYMQGQSFRKILETGQEPDGWKQAAYYQYWMHVARLGNPPAHIAIRTKEYKLIQYYGTAPEGATQADTPPAWELYHIAKDPHEMNNVYDNPEYSPVIESLKAELKRLRIQHKYQGANPAVDAVIEEFWDYDAADQQKAISISNSLYKKYADKL